MAKLPLISGRDARKAFEKGGWVFQRQRGSHMILTKPGHEGLLSIPDHKQLDRGTLRGLIADADMTVDDFLDNL